MAEETPQPLTSGKRAAKNTLFLYIRMLIVMGVTIFTSRVILQSLGEVDFGVYNVVGGIAFSFGFFSSSMTNAAQRYLSIGHGQRNIAKVKEFFNLITILYIIACGLVLLIGGCLGFWIVSKLNIPDSSYWAGVVVFYTTLVSLTITLFASAYDSVLIARESMKVYAYLSIAEALLKLGIAYLIFDAPSHRLQIYALLLLGVTVIIKGILMTYCIRKFPECKFKLKWEPAKLKGILGFMGWNGVGTLMFMVNEQGINILLNLFFGPIVNAARGIASQVNTAIGHFSNNFFMALNPQIIKSYASGEMNGTIRLTFRSSLFSFYLLWLICLPVMLRRDYILHLWLTEVPNYTSQFLFWILIYSLVNVLTNPQWTLIRAIGKLKQYIINGCITMIAAIPIGWLLFRLDFPPVWIFIVMVALRCLYVVMSLYTIHHYIDYPISQYFKQVILPIAAVCVASGLIMNIVNQWIPENLAGLIGNTMCSLIVTIFTILLFIGSDSRQQLLSMIKSKIK